MMGEPYDVSQQIHKKLVDAVHEIFTGVARTAIVEIVSSYDVLPDVIFIQTPDGYIEVRYNKICIMRWKPMVVLTKVPENLEQSITFEWEVEIFPYSIMDAVDPSRRKK